MEKQKILNSIYTNVNSPGSFGGVRNLYLEAKKVDKSISLDDVKNFLLQKPSYTLHKDLRRKFKKLPITASGIGTSAQCDLIDFHNLKRYNDGFAYILVCVDVFSRFIRVAALKSKISNEVKNGLERIFTSSYYPWSIQTDLGDFVSKELRKYYKEKGIFKYEAFSSPTVHCSLAENAIKQIKAKLGRYFTERNTRRWVDVISRVVDGLNRRKHRILGMAPIDVNEGNSQEIFEKMHVNKHSRKPAYAVGDHIRIEKKKGKFQKGYMPKFTTEVFVVSHVHKMHDPVTYEIKDLAGEPILGKFYEQEFSRVKFPDSEYEIEKILKTRKRNGKIEWFVKWKGFSDTFNSWTNGC